MRNAIAAGFALPVLLFCLCGTAVAGPLEDAQAAYEIGDYPKALSLLRPLADKRNSHAEAMLAAMYLLGKGVPQSNTEAVDWYRKAAEQGDVTAQFSLGSMYYVGQGVPLDFVDRKSVV